MLSYKSLIGCLFPRWKTFQHFSAESAQLEVTPRHKVLSQINPRFQCKINCGPRHEVSGFNKVKCTNGVWKHESRDVEHKTCTPKTWAYTYVRTRAKTWKIPTKSNSPLFTSTDQLIKLVLQNTGFSFLRRKNSLHSQNMENSPTVHTYKNIHVHKARTLTKKPESWNDSAEIKHTDENLV